MSGEVSLGKSRTRSAMVRRLVQEGLTEREICSNLGIRPCEVRVALRYIPRRYRLPREVTEALAAPAKARGISPDELAGRVLEAVIKDQLVDAILDDNGGSHAR